MGRSTKAGEGHMEHVITMIGSLARKEDGQDLMEYGILMALIAVVAMAGVTFLGDQIESVMWQTIVNNF
jgi:Flp pilus assembly pilin Flp